MRKIIIAAPIDFAAHGKDKLAWLGPGTKGKMMARVKPVYKLGEYPGVPDERTRQDLASLFAELFPGIDDPAIDPPHTGIAIAALSPRFALNLSRLSSCVALQLPWSERQDLMELAVQTVNHHFGCGFSFETRLPRAEATGLGIERLAAIPFWRSSSLFDEEQKLVIEYVQAVVTGRVPEELFARVRDRYGERGAVELTAVIGTFSLWAMLINAAL